MPKKPLFFLLVNGFLLGIAFSQWFRIYVAKEKNNSVNQQIIKNNLPFNTNGSQTHVNALNSSYINYLQSLRRDVIASASATIVCSGTISKIFYSPWTDNKFDSHEYERGLMLKDTSYDCATEYYDKLVSAGLTVFRVINGKRQVISFNNLKVGDKIITRTEMNLVNPVDEASTKNLIKTIIFKLN